MYLPTASDVVSRSLVRGLAAQGLAGRSSHFGALPAHHPAEQLFSLFERVLDGRRVTYISVPLTSGLRFARWVSRLPSNFRKSSPEYTVRYKAEVLRPNRNRARTVVKRLAEASPNVTFLNPSLLDITGWSHAHYLGFWDTILERLTDRVVLTKGWNYSGGCSFEAFAALRRGIDCRDENDVPIQISNAIIHIRRGIAELDAMGGDVARLQSALQDIEELIA